MYTDFAALPMVIFYLLVAVTAIPMYAWLIKSVGPFTVSKWIGLVCAVWSLVRLLGRQRVPYSGPMWHTCMFLTHWVVVLVSVVLRSHSVGFQPGHFTKLLAIIMLYFSTVLIVDSFAIIKRSLLVLSGAVAFSSVYVIRQYRSQAGANPAFRSWGGLTGDPNFYALVTVMVVPVCLVLMTMAKSRRQRFFCLGCLGICFPAIAVSGSRGGILSLVCAMVWLTISLRRVRYLVLGAVLLPPFLLVLPRSAVSRILQPSSSDKYAADSRIVLWRSAARIFMEHPLAGAGIDSFSEKLLAHEEGDIVANYNAVHNTYLECAAQFGLAGLLPLVLLQLSVIKSLGRVARQRPGEEVGMVARGVQAGLVGYTLGAWFVSVWWIMAYWLLIFLSFAIISGSTNLSNEAGSNSGLIVPKERGTMRTLR